MKAQEKVIATIQEWFVSGVSEFDFQANKGYIKANLNYWPAKWKTCWQVQNEGYCL
jgi:hypothetical protein